MFLKVSNGHLPVVDLQLGQCQLPRRFLSRLRWNRRRTQRRKIPFSLSVPQHLNLRMAKLQRVDLHFFVQQGQQLHRHGELSNRSERTPGNEALVFANHRILHFE